MQTPAPLKGLIFTDTGAAMTPTATKKRGKLYRYYVSMDVIKNRTTEDDSGGDQAPTRLPAGMVEDAIVTEVRRILQTPEVVTQVLAALKRDQVPRPRPSRRCMISTRSGPSCFRSSRRGSSSFWCGASPSPPSGSRSTSGAKASRASSAR